MRIYRSVCTYIWNDDKFPFASDDCQLVWFHLFTNPLSSPLGIFKASLAGLAEDKNRNGSWTQKRYKDAFTEGIREGFIEYDEKALLIAFPKYFSKDHVCNYPHSINVVKSWGKRFNELPASYLKDNCYQSLRTLLEGMNHAFIDAFTDAFTKASAMPSRMPSRMTNPNPNPDLSSPSSSLVLTNFFLSPEMILSLWNEMGLVLCKKLSAQFHRKIETLIKAHPAKEWWIDLFLRVKNSDFLAGRVKEWSATLDWVLGPKNLAKIEQGNYDNRTSGSGVDAMKEAFLRS